MLSLAIHTEGPAPTAGAAHSDQGKIFLNFSISADVKESCKLSPIIFMFREPPVSLKPVSFQPSYKVGIIWGIKI